MPLPPTISSPPQDHTLGLHESIKEWPPGHRLYPSAADSTRSVAEKLPHLTALVRHGFPRLRRTGATFLDTMTPMETTTMSARLAGIFVCSATLLSACDAAPAIPQAVKSADNALVGPGEDPGVNKDWRNPALGYGLRLSAAAEERATHSVVYDASYQQVSYPNGDVAADRGVCADEIVRAYRLLGVDLQRLVHEDMTHSFSVYPKRWGLKGPDKNIDHRRVPNLATFFVRHKADLPVTASGDDYQPGDVVAWALADGRPHIGMVTERRSSDGKRPLVMHNIGFGPQIEDMLFGLTITGHYRFQETGSARRS